HPASGGGVLDGVVQDVEEQPNQVIGIAGQAQIRRDLLDQPQCLGLSQRPYLVHDGIQQVTQRDGLQLHGLAALAQTGQEQQVVRQPDQPIGFAPHVVQGVGI